MSTDAVLVAEVVRSGLVESRHYGSFVIIGSDGEVVAAAGRTDEDMYPRSAHKPAQATAMVRQGLPLAGELLALAAASHSGEDFHVDGVRRILESAGLNEAALQNPPGWPLDEAARDAVVRAGGAESRLLFNCSGKHAAMLATCVANGWPTESYLSADHPLQKGIQDTIGELSDERLNHAGVDGCGAPLFTLTLAGLARLFRSLALASSGSDGRRVVAAIQAHPEFTSGSTRDEARLIRAVPGLFGKSGAEGVYAVAFDDGRAVALKIDDGGARARPVVMAELLRRLGLDLPILDEIANVPVLGGGRPVGEIRAGV